MAFPPLDEPAIDHRVFSPSDLARLMGLRDSTLFPQVDLDDLLATTLFAKPTGTPELDWIATAESWVVALWGSPSPNGVRVPDRFDLTWPGPSTAWYVVEGELEEWRGSFRVAVRKAGDLLGAAFALAGQAPATRIVARRETIVLPIHTDAFVALLDDDALFRERVLLDTARVAVQYADDEDQNVQALDRALIDGGATLIPGPFRATVELVTLELTSTSGFTEYVELLPPGVTLATHTLKPMVTLARFSDLRHANLVGLPSRPYDELNLFLPVEVTPPGGATLEGLFVVHMFPDNTLMTALGREISGFPKVVGSSLFDEDEDGGGGRFITGFGERTLAEVRFRLGDPLRGLDDDTARTIFGPLLDPLGTNFAWKRILAPSAVYPLPTPSALEWSPDVFDVDALVATPMDMVPDWATLRVVEDASWVLDRDVFPDSLGLSDLGLAITAELTQQPSETVIDYRSAPYPGLPPTHGDRVRLRWGFRKQLPVVTA